MTSDDKIQKLLVERVNRSSDPASPRYGGIGGSQVAAITGHSEFDNALDVYHDATRLPGERPPPNTEQLRGILLEDDIAQMYEILNPGHKLRRTPIARHPTERWAVVHVDRVILSTSTGEGAPDVATPLEIKAPRRETFRKSVDEGLRQEYVIQMQHTLFVKRKNEGRYAIGHTEESEMVMAWTMRRSETSIEMIERVGRAFWHECVLPRVAPDPDAWREEVPDLPEPDGITHQLEAHENARLTYVVAKYRRLKRLEKKLKEEIIPEARAELEAAFADADVARVRISGVGRAYLAWRAGRRTFDYKLLADHRPVDRDAVMRLIASIRSEGKPEIADGLEELLREGVLDLDLSPFYRQGEPYEELRTFEDNGPIADPQAMVDALAAEYGWSDVEQLEWVDRNLMSGEGDV